MMYMSEEKDRTDASNDKETWILVTADEVGDLGKKAKWNGTEYKPSKIFGFGLSIINDMDKFAEISSSYKKERGIEGEFKAKKRTAFEKMILAFKIHMSGAKTYGVYVDKTKDRPKGWKRQNGLDIQMGTLKRALGEVLSEVESERITIAVDDERIYHEEDEDGNEIRDIIGDLSEQLSREHNKNITCITVGEEDDEFFKQMETNDLVANAIYDREEKDRSLPSLLMDQKLIRLGKRDSIKNGDILRE